MSENLSDYERDEYEKLMMVVKAGIHNLCQHGLRITTVGSDPAASVTISALLLSKLLEGWEQ